MDERSYRGFLMDVEDLDEPGSDVEEDDTNKSKEPPGSLSKKRRHSGSSGAESSGFKWMESAEEESCPGWLYPDYQHSITDPPLTRRPRPILPVPSSESIEATAVSSAVSPLACDHGSNTAWPVSSMRSPIGSAWDGLRSTSRSPGCSDQDPVSAAAYLHLLGESLSLIGLHLQETNKLVCASGSLSLLLDSLLCSLPPLISLTSQIPELKSCVQHTLDSTLENIAYVMPGL